MQIGTAVCAGVIIIVMLKASPASCLRCLQCTTRDYPGCLLLDNPVAVQQCTEGEVCVKTVARIKNHAHSILTQGVIRDCVKYSPELGPKNGCILLPGGTHPSTKRCLCDDRDECNKAVALKKLNFKSHLLFMLICSLFTFIMRNIIFIPR